MDIAELTDRIHPYVDFATAIGTLLALIAIVVAVLQLRDAHHTAMTQMDTANQYAVAQNWIALRAILTTYDDIHANLRPQGPWHKSKEKPDTVQEWSRANLYMGTFEFMEDLVEQKMLDIDHIEHWYRYRVENILLNPRIVKYDLIGNRSNWVRFYKFCQRLGLDMPNEQTGLAPYLAAPDRGKAPDA